MLYNRSYALAIKWHANFGSSLRGNLCEFSWRILDSDTPFVFDLWIRLVAGKVIVSLNIIQQRLLKHSHYIVRCPQTGFSSVLFTRISFPTLSPRLNMFARFVEDPKVKGSDSSVMKTLKGSTRCTWEQPLAAVFYFWGG